MFQILEFKIFKMKTQEEDHQNPWEEEDINN